MSEYIDHLTEQMQEFADVQTRKMFGGYGVFYQGIMFALVADEQLYFKSDDRLAIKFQQRGLTQFEFNKAGKAVKMSYYQAPEEVLEDRDEMTHWCREAYQVALSANVKKRK